MTMDQVLATLTAESLGIATAMLLPSMRFWRARREGKVVEPDPRAG